MNSAMVQLNPYIPVVASKGKGEAKGRIDYGKGEDLPWIVFRHKKLSQAIGATLKTVRLKRRIEATEL